MILILYFVKASVVISVAAATLVVVGRKSSAALRHLICTLAIAGLLALPISRPSSLSGSFANIEGPANSRTPRTAASLAGPAKAGHDVLPAKSCGSG